MSRSVIINKSPATGRTGFSLVMTIIFLAVIMILVTLIYDRTNSNVQSTSRRVNDQDAIRLAEAGIEKSVWCLNNPGNTADCPGNPNYGGETAVPFGHGTFTTEVTGSGNTRTIDAFSTINGSSGTSTKHLQVQLATTTADVSFSYGLQAGVGGLDMKNNNQIMGNVFSSGPVTGLKSVITGDVVLTRGSPTPDAVSDPSVNPLVSLNFGTNGATDDYIAQSFVPSVTDKIYSLDLKLAKHNAPASTITAAIYSDSSGNPGADLTAGGQNMTVTLPNDSPAGWENGWTTQIFSPSTNPILAAGQTYWLVLKTSSASSTKYWVTVRDATNGSYSGGQAKLNGDTVAMPNACAGAGCDIAFRVNMGGVPSSLSVDCSGSICVDGTYAIGGNVYAETIDSTNIKQHACYLNTSGTVKAGQGSTTCTGSSTAPVPCDNSNTQYTTGPYCHAGNPTLAPVDFPLSSSQIAQTESQAAAGGIINCPTGCTLSSGAIGPKKYIGDVTISGGVTLTGTIWVKGNLTMTSTITLDNAYGSNSGTVIADNPDDPINSGRIIIGNGGNAVGNSTADTYIMLLSKSQTTSDTDGAVDVSNNLTAGVVYAANGSVVLKNSADLKEVTGERIVLQNGSDVTYETGLASVVFTSGPGGSWIYQRGSYQIIK